MAATTCRAYSHSECSIFQAADGDIYVLAGDDEFNSYVRFSKATDPTSSFSDAGTRQQVAGVVRSVAGFQVGDKIHIATQDATSSVRYGRFDMSDDTWDVTPSTDIITDPGSDSEFTAIAVRGDGDIVLFYEGDKYTSMGKNYKRMYAVISTNNGTSWGTPFRIDSQSNTVAEPEWIGGPRGVVVGASDRIHIAWTRKNALHHRTLNSNDTFGTDQTLDSAATNLHAVDGGNQHSRIVYDGTDLRIVYADSNETLSEITATEAENPTWGSIGTGIAEKTTQYRLDSNIYGWTHQIALNGTDLYLVHTDIATGDVYTNADTGSGWAASDTSRKVHPIASQYYDIRGAAIYVRGGNYKLGYAYTDTGAGTELLYFDEVDLGAATSTYTTTHTTDTRMIAFQATYPDQDVVKGSWDTSPSASQLLHDQIDESTPSDADYIYSESF